MRELRQYSQNLAIFGLYSSVVIDNANAVAQRYVGISGTPFQFLKLLIIVFCFVALEKHRLLIALFLELIFMSFPLAHIFLNQGLSPAWYFSDFVYFQKIASFPIVCMFAEQYARMYGIRHFVNVAVFSYFLIALNLILSAFGFGFSQYEGDNGVGQGLLGFFISGNEVTGLQLVTSAILLSYIYVHKRNYYALMCFVVVAFGALKGTKSGLGGSLVFAFVFPLLLGGGFKRINVRKLLISIVLVPPLITISAVGVWSLLDKFNVFSRWVYFLGKLGLVSMLFSTRDQRIVPLFNEIDSSWGIGKWIFGLGCPEQPFRTYVEIDSIDLLQSSGIVGALLILLIWTLILVSFLRRVRGSSELGKACAFTYFFIFLFLSNSAGHIMYAGMVLPFLGVLYGISYGKKPGFG